MRFLEFEHKAVKEAIEAAGLDFADFRSVKRQGKLHLFYRAHPQPFKFFRRQETKLNPEGKWEKLTIYLLYPEGKPIETDSWDGVMAAFRGWLATL